MSKKKIDHAVVWLQTHDLISINRLEKKVGIPQRVLSKVITGLDGRTLPEKYHKALLKELKEYGFK